MKDITHPESIGYIGPDDISDNAPGTDILPPSTCPPDWWNDPHIDIGEHP